MKGKIDKNFIWTCLKLKKNEALKIQDEIVVTKQDIMEALF